MPIAGVVVLTQSSHTQNVLESLQKQPNVTTYGVHKENHIIAVLEAETTKELKNMSEEITRGIPGVLGVYPAYINFEDEQDVA